MRMHFTVVTLLVLILILTFIYIALLVEESTKSEELVDYLSEVERIQKENDILKVEILVHKAYTTIKQQAENEGYIPIESTDYVQY